MLLDLQLQLAALTARVATVEAKADDAGDIDDLKLYHQNTGGGTWPGDAFLARYRWYDPDISADTTGQEIIDNSGGAKTYLVLDRLNNQVTYETGPRPDPMPDGEEWYDVSTLVDSPHVSGL